MQISIALSLLLAGIALALPGIFKSDGWPDWKNGLVALVVVAVFSGLTAWADGSLVGGTFAANWAITAGIFGGLLAGPAQPLDQWLQSHFNLPFLKPAPVNANPVRMPTALPITWVPTVPQAIVQSQRASLGTVNLASTPPAMPIQTGQGDPKQGA